MTDWMREFRQKALQVYNKLELEQELNKQSEMVVPKMEILMAKNKSLSTLVTTSLVVSVLSVVAIVIMFLSVIM